jgi:hypothetical protein
MAKPRAYRLASDFTLHQWSEAGDVLATFEVYHRQTVRQMVQDVTADPPTSHGPPHHVIYLSAAMPLHFFKGVFGHQRVTLIIDPEASKEAILKYWPDILAWRRRLETWQGPLRPRVPQYLTNLKGWHQVWRRGALAEPSLSELARWVNREIAVELEGALETIRDTHGDTPPIPLEQLLEYPSWSLPRGHWSAALAHPVWLMELWGVPRTAIRQSFLQAIQNLKAGKPAFTSADEPIDRDRIWAKLKRLDAER